MSITREYAALWSRMHQLSACRLCRHHYRGICDLNHAQFDKCIDNWSNENQPAGGWVGLLWEPKDG
jgi:hypothetical protein